MFVSLSHHYCLLILAVLGAAVAETITDPHASPITRTADKHIRARELTGVEFKLNNDEVRNCDWVATSDTAERCKKLLKNGGRVEKECPNECAPPCFDYCNAYTIFLPECAGCPPIPLCDSWCSSLTCGTPEMPVLGCSGCAFCQFGEPCDFSNCMAPESCERIPDQCSGCPICNEEENKFCQSWCSPGICEFTFGYCKDCDFCNEPIPPITPTCQPWCDLVMCDTGVEQCAGCPYCKDPMFCDSFCQIQLCEGNERCRDCDFCNPEPPCRCESTCNKFQCGFGNECCACEICEE